MSSHSPFISNAVIAHYVVSIIDFMAPRGVYVQALLANTGLREVDLRQAPDQPITLVALFELLHNLHTEDPSPTLSFEYGLSLQLSHHGFLGYALQSSQTLGDALQLAHDFAQTRSQIIRFSTHQDADCAIIRLEDHGALERWYAHVIEALLGCFYSIGNTLLGRIGPNQVTLNLALAEQAHHHVLKHLFGSNVRFNCQVTEISVPISWLNTPLPKSDPQLAALAEARCRDELAHNQQYACLQPQPVFITNVLSAISQHIASADAQAQVAQALHMTPRTLHRRLAQHGLQFKMLLDELRQHQAKALLQSRRESLASIALALGYSDQANFVRAFKRWTNQTPSQFLRALP